MTFWMYHTLTGSVYPVPTDNDEDVAKLADRLPHRIYFRAELTTQPLEPEQWWVKDEAENMWHSFLYEHEARDFAQANGFPLYVREFRAYEQFLTEIKEK